MTKQEFLAMSLPYELKILDGNGDIAILQKLDVRGYFYSNFDEEDAIAHKICDNLLPIIRHISDLTKPITHKGDTFVPTERLMWDESYVESYHKDNINTNEATFSDVLKLIEWVFWPDMPEDEEVVYVTDEFNPYN